MWRFPGGWRRRQPCRPQPIPGPEPQPGREPGRVAVPVERPLFETDHPCHPFGDRDQPAPRRPGNLSNPEAAVAAKLSSSATELRRQAWRNFSRLVDELELAEMFPRDFQV